MAFASWKSPWSGKISPVREHSLHLASMGHPADIAPTVTNVAHPRQDFSAVSRMAESCSLPLLHASRLRFETTTGLQTQTPDPGRALGVPFAHRVVCVSHSVREKAIASVSWIESGR